MEQPFSYRSVSTETKQSIKFLHLVKTLPMFTDVLSVPIVCLCVFVYHYAVT